MTPREGNYLPSIEIPGLPLRLQVKVIEGPASLRPGDGAVVVMQLTPAGAARAEIEGKELTIYEGSRAVGFGHIVRLW